MPKQVQQYRGIAQIAKVFRSCKLGHLLLEYVLITLKKQNYMTFWKVGYLIDITKYPETI
jgi:hypothetical protein